MVLHGPADTGIPGAAAAAPAGTLHLCIYVAGDSPASRLALAHLSGVLDALGIPGEHLSVVDVLRDPTAAFAAGVVVTPALRVDRGDRAQWFVGDLSRRDQLANFLA